MSFRIEKHKDIQQSWKEEKPFLRGIELYYAKNLFLFTGSYALLTVLGILLNTILSTGPAISINVAAAIISALIVLRVRRLTSKNNIDVLFLSVTGGVNAVIAIFLLSLLFSNFQQPNYVESVASFFFNAIAVYITTLFYFRSKKSDV